MTESPRAVAAQASPLTAIGGLVAAGDLEELALAAAPIPAQLLGAREAVVVLRSSSADLVEIVARHPAAAGTELDPWALRQLRLPRVGEDPAREGTRLAVGIDPTQGWSGVIAVDVARPDAASARGLVELGRIVSRCVGQIVSLKHRAAALDDARQSIGKGLHDLRTPLNSLRLGLHLLEPGLAGQDPQVVRRTHRAVDRLASLVTEMYDSLQQTTASR